jgi:hypothetical protein
MSFDPDRAAARIAKARTASANAVWEIGSSLLQAKRSLPHGEFLQFLRRAQVNFDPRTAQNYMVIARQPDGRDLSTYGLVKARLLCRLTTEDRPSFIENHSVDQLSTAELQQRINDFRGFTSGPRETLTQAYKRGYQDGYRDATTKHQQPRQPSDALGWALGVLHLHPDTLTPDALTRAYRRLAQLFHPDKGLDTDGSFMTDLNNAKDKLDEILRHDRTHAA